ncbi:LysE family translocator [Arsenicibacter rosenii]|uniref:Lysine transporter LysE n=1 Tax=Arsenicibacter rosenii TaxID=1750698 RepID=A0A1S2VI25_9BACT|nr:LysE family transporter [Arsenicibacter rosenii]OIN57498.1 hypothetical protein BLX24_19935 [Arsenicibacter rosenii]
MIALFFVVATISFLGSIHPGPVNLAVANATLTQNRNAGLWLALGGSLPEIPYSALAINGLSWLPNSRNLDILLRYLPVPVLLLAGISALRSPERVHTTPTTVRQTNPFWQGIMLGGTNPQLIPFWSAIWLYLSQNTVGPKPLIPEQAEQAKVIFFIATGCGAFFLLAVVAWLTDRLRCQVLQPDKIHRLNRLTGFTFLGMAAWQCVVLWNG